MNWVQYFRQNRASRKQVPWKAGLNIDVHLRPHLIRSLQRFQMGERGDGFHLKRVSAQGGPAYQAAINLFVEEEQEHAALMAAVLCRLGAPLLESHWSDRCFRIICLASGLRAELMVLLVAEIIAKRYFRLLYEASLDPVLQAVCSQIRRDEDAHIAFHSDTLHSLFVGLPPVALGPIRALWRLFFSAVCLVVIYDHRKLLKAAEISPWAFLRDCLHIFEDVGRQVFAGRSSAAHDRCGVGTPALPPDLRLER